MALVTRGWDEPAKDSVGGRGWLAARLVLWATQQRKPEENVS